VANYKSKATQIRTNLEALRVLHQELTTQAAQVSVLSYVPLDKQAIFHRSQEKIRLYIGGNRSGKTLGSVMEGIYWSRKEHPHQRLPLSEGEAVRGRVCGVDFQNGVEKILLPQYAASVPKSMLINGSWSDSYNGNKRTLEFTNGSFVEFMSYDQDLDKFAGTSRHWVHMDEEPPKSIYIENYARIVDTNGRLWISMTPIEGMTWIYDTLYEPGLTGEKPNVKVVIVDTTENSHLSSEALQDFISTLDEEDVEARVHGRFIQMGGLIYKSFDPMPGGLHVIDKTLRPPSNWQVYLALDHGFNNPTAVGWHMVSPEGEAITYREYYERGRTIAENAKFIKQEIFVQQRMPDFLIADPSIRNRDPITGTSILQEYAKEGLYFALGNNDVKGGISRVQGYLKPMPTSDGVLRPKWRVTSDCPMHIKEMTRYRWKTYENKAKQFDNNPYEEPHKKDDHAMDELRYFLMSRPDIMSDIDSIENELRRRESALRGNSMFAPGAITHGARASDFYSGSHMVDDEYAGSYTGEGDGIEYDEHMGGVW